MNSLTENQKLFLLVKEYSCFKFINSGAFDMHLWLFVSLSRWNNSGANENKMSSSDGDTVGKSGKGTLKMVEGDWICSSAE